MGSLIIPCDYINEMDDLELFLYASTQMYMRHSIPNLMMPIEKFRMDAFQVRKLTKIQKEKLDKALALMQEQGLLKAGRDVEIYPPKFKPPDGIFCVHIDLDAFYSIANSNHRFDIRWALFHYYCRLISSLDYNIEVNGKRSVVGHMSQAFFMDKAELSQQTVSRYHKYLEDMQLIYTNRCVYLTENGKRRKNYYGRYEDRKLIDQFVKED